MPGPPVRLGLKFTPGDTFRYTDYVLDQYGFPIADSTQQETWRVVGTNQIYRGFSGVVVIADSIGAGEYDTLRFAVTAQGDLFQYGFIADLLGRIEGLSLAPQWDSLAAFSLGFNNSWVLTGGDTTADEKTVGVITGEVDYFSVAVNGVPTAYATYRVELTRSDVEHDFWVSDAPTSFASFREDVVLSPFAHLRLLTSLNSASP